MKLSEFNLLTEEEQQCYHALKTLKGDGMWQGAIKSWFKAIDGEDDVWREAINNQVNHGSAEGFRHLLASLQSQAADNPRLMQLILGPSAYQLLMSLEPIPV